MTNYNDCQIQITNRANRTFIKEDGCDAACYSTIIRDFSNERMPNSYTLKMSFELSDREAMQISRALKHTQYHMQSDVMGRFEIELQGEANLITGLNALFKRSTDGGVISSGSAKESARPLVSLAMQDIIVAKLGGLLTNSARVRDNLDEDQKDALSLPVYD